MRNLVLHLQEILQLALLLPDQIIIDLPQRLIFHGHALGGKFELVDVLFLVDEFPVTFCEFLGDGVVVLPQLVVILMDDVELPVVGFDYFSYLQLLLFCQSLQAFYFALVGLLGGTLRYLRLQVPILIVDLLLFLLQIVDLLLVLLD